MAGLSALRVFRARLKTRLLGANSNKPPQGVIDLSGAVASMRNSPLFDADWYLYSYADVREAGLDPAAHYVEHGAAERRSPGPAFDGAWYLNKNADVREARMNPLLHYINHGAAEGRAPNPVVDRNWAASHNAEVEISAKPKQGEPDERRGTLTHGVTAPKAPTQDAPFPKDLREHARVVAAHALFDERWYVAMYRDVPALNLTPAEHYLRLGAADGRDPGPYFRTSWYTKTNANAIPPHMNPFLHYVLHGEAEGRLPRPEILHLRYPVG